VSPSAVRPGPTRVPPRRPRHHRWRSPVPQARATAPPAAWTPAPPPAAAP